MIRAAKEQTPSFAVVERLLADETVGDGGAICRFAREDKLEDKIATLFSIVMDLENKRSRVIVGRPTEPTQRLYLDM